MRPWCIFRLQKRVMVKQRDYQVYVARAGALLIKVPTYATFPIALEEDLYLAPSCPELPAPEACSRIGNQQ